MPAFCALEFASPLCNAKCFSGEGAVTRASDSGLDVADIGNLNSNSCISFRAASTERMKSTLFAFALSLAFLIAQAARADLTLIQKIDGLDTIASEMTIKIKGDKVRIDPSPKMSTIFDGTTGELTTLVRDEKTVVRMSADKIKAAAAMLKQFNTEKEGAKPKLVATGQKETINGFETEQYVYDGPDFKATYWIAPKYPNGDEILKQLQAVKSEAWNAANSRLPDYHVFPGLPIRTRVTTKHEGAHEFTTTITAAKLDPISDSEFSVPADFKEFKMPDVFGGKGAPSGSPPK
jgi:Domain of unknown function (DUF4412)